MARGNERRPIFLDDEDREQYLGRLSHYRDKFGFTLLQEVQEVGSVLKCCIIVLNGAATKT